MDMPQNKSFSTGTVIRYSTVEYRMHKDEMRNTEYFFKMFEILYESWE